MTSVTKAYTTIVEKVFERVAQLSLKYIASLYKKAVCKKIWIRVCTWERFALGGYLICSLRSILHTTTPLLASVTSLVWPLKGVSCKSSANSPKPERLWLCISKPSENVSWSSPAVNFLCSQRNLSVFSLDTKKRLSICF